jgi:hypothetical protein
MPKFIVDSTAQGIVTLRTPHNNYRTSFRAPAGATLPAAGEPVHGTIRARAWKVEAVSLGGNYVEPLYGRPRRMQGTVLETLSAGNELRVMTPYEVVVTLPEKYRAAQFAVGTRVGFDCLEIPVFELDAAPSASAATPV